MKGKFITYEDGNFTGPIGKEFYVHSAGFKRIFKTYLEIEARLLYLRLGSPLSHQQLWTSIPSSLPTSSNGFFIEIHENIIKVDFFIEDDIWALEHHDVCTYKFSSWRWLWRFLVKFCDSTQDLFKHTKHFST